VHHPSVILSEVEEPAVCWRGRRAGFSILLRSKWQWMLRACNGQNRAPAFIIC